MIGEEWAAIFPFGITRAIAFTNGHPAVPAYGLSRSCVSLFEPGDDERRFRLELAMCDIVVRQRAVERVLARNERYRNIIAPGRWIGVIDAAIVLFPLLVPNALAYLFFADPKDSGHDAGLPRVTLYGRGRVKRCRFTQRRDFTDLLLP